MIGRTARAHDQAAGSLPFVPIESTPVRHPGRWIGTAILSVVVVGGLHSVATNPQFHWATVGAYLFDELVLRGIAWTLGLTCASMALAISLAILLALMRHSENQMFRRVSWIWVWFFRGTPVYTQLVFWGLVPVLYQRVSLGIPRGPELFSFSTSEVITATAGAILGLGLNESAYLAEIFRAGLKSVDSGQVEAAEALGIRKSKAMRRIVLPQAMRVIVPPTGNETIGMLKTTSLVLAVPFTLDLTFVTTSIANRIYLPIPLLIVAAVWYLVITSVLMTLQHFIEKHYGKGVDGGPSAPAAIAVVAPVSAVAPDVQDRSTYDKERSRS
jgi:polar amino acid transport system permease protein